MTKLCYEINLLNLYAFLYVLLINCAVYLTSLFCLWWCRVQSTLEVRTELRRPGRVRVSNVQTQDAVRTFSKQNLSVLGYGLAIPKT